MCGRLANVLVVEDDPGVAGLISDSLAGRDMSCRVARNVHEAKCLLLTGDYDVAVVDLLLPGGSGLDLPKLVSEHRLDTRVICISGAASRESDRLARQAGAWEFFEKPFDVLLLTDAILRAAGGAAEGESRGDGADGQPGGGSGGAWESFESYRAALLSVGSYRTEDKPGKMMLEFAVALVVAVEAKDPHTRRHSEHVAFYAENLARHVGLPADLLQTLRIAGLVHDIGKIAVPDSVLTKPGRLTARELGLIRQHPEVGAEILKNVSLMTTESRLVRQHHENWDGSGYPTGLSGESILLGARILNIADSVDAMLMRRTYKPGYPVSRMLDELGRCAGGQFDPVLARAAVEWCRQNSSKLILPGLGSASRTA